MKRLMRVGKERRREGEGRVEGEEKKGKKERGWSAGRGAEEKKRRKEKEGIKKTSLAHFRHTN